MAIEIISEISKTMIMRILLLSILSLHLLIGKAVFAQELTPHQIRQAVSDGRSVSFGKIARTIQNRTKGEIMDVRAFENDGIYYRVLISRPNGNLASVVVDAATGRLLSTTSPKSRAVQKAANTAPNNGKGKGSGNGNGNGNSGGNGNGNSGGNGNGNGGENGNGNGGENGNGNGGENGNGNGGENGNGNGGENGNGNGGENGNAGGI
ncbi:PepSY domain-containing protein [Profundibacter amoris]|uniref:PepSY domain-containing protein n=1 Tax=Profundibacter amoris TaxID=2171755 RepID=UPI0018889DF4|nr:hypothetical protein [Profundibacter amoris]